MCSDVFMGATRHITIRIPEIILEEIDAEAVRLKVSRAWVISRRLENSRTLPPLYSVEVATGKISVVRESGENYEQEGIPCGTGNSAAGRLESGNKGGGEVGGELLGLGHNAPRAGRAHGKGDSKASQAVSEKETVNAWFPTSKCPHGCVNSFVCEQNNGGCHR